MDLKVAKRVDFKSPHHKKINGYRRWWRVLANATGGIISQYKNVSNQHTVHFKRFKQCHILVISQKSRRGKGKKKRIVEREP